MKKIILIMAVAMAAMSCGNKAEKAEAAPAEAVQPAPAEAVQPAPAAPAQEAAPEKEQGLLERAIELGQDVKAEVEKNK